MKINENNLFTVLTTASSLLAMVLTIAGWVFISWSFATGVLAGGLVAIANGYWLRNILQRAMELPSSKAVRYVHLRYGIRLGILAVIISLLILYGKINILGLLLGLSVLVIGIVAIAIYLATIDGG